MSTFVPNSNQPQPRQQQPKKESAKAETAVFNDFGGTGGGNSQAVKPGTWGTRLIGPDGFGNI